MIDFDKMFEASGLSPLPDAELKQLLDGLAQHLTGDDIAAYIVAVKRFDERPVQITESYPGEYLINMNSGRIVHWWHLRKDCAAIPMFMTAASVGGLSYAESVELLRAVVDTNRYDFGGVDDLIKSTADMIEISNKRGVAFHPSLAGYNRFLVEAKKDGEVDRAFGIARLGMVAGMSVEQSLDIVQAIYDGPGIAGYVFRDLYDELETLGVHGAGGDLFYRALKAAHANRIGFSTFSAIIHSAATHTAYSHREIFEKIDGVLRLADDGAADTEGTALARRGSNAIVESSDPVDKLVALLVPSASDGPVVTKDVDDYFPELGLDALVHGVLPYRVNRSLRDGLSDLRQLMETAFPEGSWVFAPETETWYSLGGRTEVRPSRVRHDFFPYDVSALSLNPVFVHVHPKGNEVFISPNRDSLAFPQLQKKLVSFLTALPSGADFLELSTLNRLSTRPVELTGLIVTSQGITEFSAPADAENVEAFAGSFKFDKGEAMTNFDAANYLAEYGIVEPDHAFIDRLLPAVRQKLPPGFEITLSTFDDFDFDKVYSSSSQRPMPTLPTASVGP
ncbi:hypothetical protein [Rhizobium sp. BK176]|uniref:hypothetical protein n=1 Tax=Rhizobium sp. BK176 TaxID=2587071 RepID=UPI0021693957|nr:hypothetical protein [Rhizobium sp. BK176]MCS4089957.1 hypothetical protein [Rhizobium sp. BK176]